MLLFTFQLVNQRDMTNQVRLRNKIKHGFLLTENETWLLPYYFKD